MYDVVIFVCDTSIGVFSLRASLNQDLFFPSLRSLIDIFYALKTGIWFSLQKKYIYIYIYTEGASKKKVDKCVMLSREAPQCTMFCIKIDCLGRIDRENEKFRTSILGELCLLRRVKYALRAKRECLKLILTW